jgi:hypothetical protein
MRLLPIAAALLAAALLVPAPASAGKTEDAFLSRLVGVWSGGGRLTGAETGSVDCKMTMRQRSDGIAFRVQCIAADLGPQTFSGTLTYNDARGRYEAISNGGEVTVGTRQGNSVVFVSKMKGIATGESVMNVASSRIVVDTTVRRSANSGDIRSRIELKR